MRLGDRLGAHTPSCRGDRRDDHPVRERECPLSSDRGPRTGPVWHSRQCTLRLVLMGDGHCRHQHRPSWTVCTLCPVSVGNRLCRG